MADQSKIFDSPNETLKCQHSLKEIKEIKEIKVERSKTSTCNKEDSKENIERGEKLIILKCKLNRSGVLKSVSSKLKIINPENKGKNGSTTKSISISIPRNYSDIEEIIENDSQRKSNIVILKSMKKKKWIIGDFCMDKDLLDAIKYEHDTGIHPGINKNIDDYRNRMERYVARTIQFEINNRGLGTLELCPDGCASDIMYTSKKHENKYIGGQIKTTARITWNDGSYRWVFTDVGKDYKGMFVYCHVIEEGKSWLFPHKFYKEHFSSDHLRIYESGNMKSSEINWQDFEIKDYDDLANKLEKYFEDNSPSVFYDGITIKNKEDLIVPISKMTQNEHIYREKIMPTLKKLGLKIKMAPLESDSFDMTLGELKVQEKAGLLREINGLPVKLFHNGKYYKPSDFGILLIHLPKPFEKFFYFINTKELIKRGRLETDTCFGKKDMLVYPWDLKESKFHSDRDEWANQFLFHYDDPNIVIKLMNIYNRQLKKFFIPMIIEDEPIWYKGPCENLTQLFIKYNITREYPLSVQLYAFTILGKRIILTSSVFYRNKDKKIHIISSYKENAIKRSIPYKKGDGDFLLAHLPKDYVEKRGKGFYFIPLNTLIENNVLGIEREDGQAEFTINKSREWIHDYYMKYDDDEETIIKIKRLIKEN